VEKIRFKHIVMALVLVFILAKGVNLAVENTRERELAQRLGIDRDAYPRKASFPSSYFYEKLKPGITTRKEVHEIVIEYELVLQCYEGSEVYYYYSKDDDETLRFEIWYDFDGKYSKILGENDSYRINTESCGPGLLPE